MHGPSVDLPFRLFGSSYGAWTVPDGVLTRTSTVYSVGIGEDVTFDLALINLVGCDVHAFDPTPTAKSWLQGLDIPAKFHFYPLGVANFDGEAEFFVSASEDDRSFGSKGTSEGEQPDSLMCPVRRVKTIMDMLGHTEIDLLKMDIEGFEYGVIDDLVELDRMPKILEIEFHHKAYGYGSTDTRMAVEKLLAVGYSIYWVSDLGREYGFIRNNL